LRRALAPQPVPHAAPELRVAADVVVRVRIELASPFVEPHLSRAVAQVLPHGVGIPVRVFLRHEVAALDDQEPRAGRGEGVRDRAAAGPAADDDDVVDVSGRGHSDAYTWSMSRWSSIARSRLICGGAPVWMAWRKSRYIAR